MITNFTQKLGPKFFISQGFLSSQFLKKKIVLEKVSFEFFLSTNFGLKKFFLRL